MLKSMTAFAREVGSNEQGEISWELRSVNHRYLELALRIPEEFKSIETAARELLQKRLGRGKVNAALRFSFVAQQQADIHVNAPLIDAIIRACNTIELQMGQGVAMNSLDILKYPGVVEEPRIIVDDFHSLVLETLDRALDELIDARQREGQRLQQLLVDRSESMQTIVQQVRERMPQVKQAVREKLQTRLSELNAQPDKDRLEQELVYIAQKMDVDEELDRLEGHLKELDNVMMRDEPVGRRLDFLMQEFNREANTLGSKSADLATTQASVELKVLIEQMREQVQNIE